jgi:hypothetical protein
MFSKFNGIYFFGLVPAALNPGNNAGTHCIGGWVGLTAGLDGCGKFAPIGIRSPDRPTRSELLFRLSYPGGLDLD